MVGRSSIPHFVTWGFYSREFTKKKVMSSPLDHYYITKWLVPEVQYLGNKTKISRKK